MHGFYAREASHLRVVLTPKESALAARSSILKSSKRGISLSPRLWNRTPLEIDAEEKS